MTPQDRQCINELLEAACISGASLEATGRSIGQLMLHLTAELRKPAASMQKSWVLMRLIQHRRRP
jgi:hypothetical protein